MSASFRIQRVARGLLSLLDMKGGGVLPPELAGQIVATVNAEQYFAADSLTTLGNSLALAGAIGDTVYVLGTGVPEGEVWRVLAISSRTSAWTLAGAKAIGVGVQYQGQPMQLLGVGQATVIAGDQLGVVSNLSEPFILTSGAFVGATILQNGGGGTCTLDTRLLFHRLRA